MLSVFTGVNCLVLRACVRIAAVAFCREQYFYSQLQLVVSAPKPGYHSECVHSCTATFQQLTVVLVYMVISESSCELTIQVWHAHNYYVATYLILYFSLKT